MLRKLATALILLGLSALPGRAACEGENLIEAMEPAARAELEAAADAIPHAQGNLWRAERGGQVMHLLGTYHLDDPRHAGILATALPLLEDAGTVLVEAGPEEEEALKARLAREPSLMLITEGPTLLEQMEPEEWALLAAAMELRGIPAFMASKLRPWYVAMLLGIAPCAMESLAEPNGLDRQIVDAAAAAGVPVRALEPYDTIFGLFSHMSPEEQLGMIRSTLALEDKSEAMGRTLADLYFAEQSRLIWEFARQEARNLPGYTPEQIEAEFARMEQVLMNDRNRAWIPVIETAAAEGPVLVAFGALHLSGEEGVLALLEAAGWRVERVAL